MIFDPALDLFPLLAGALAAMTCGLLGNFLVLRRQSLMGDAISHAVLPGLVIAFLIGSSRDPLLMFGGATVAGLSCVVLIELVKRLGRVEPGAAMGVVFSVMFALGVLLIEQAAARHVDLDADCVLYGQLEILVWFDAPQGFAGLWSLETLWALPRQVVVLLVMLASAGLFVLLFFKELRITAFDPDLATAQGIHAGVMHYALMILVAAATVASFEAVGSILVIAMLIAPAATARLLTDRLVSQILVSLVVALLSACGGYVAATAIPAAFGAGSVNAAGSMTVVAGLLVGLAAWCAPSHGLLARAWRRRRLARAAAVDDLLAALWRMRESGAGRVRADSIVTRSVFDLPLARRIARRQGLLEVHGAELALTPAGAEHAARQVRRHRQWERYLAEHAGVAVERVHDHAEDFEHFAIEPGGGGLDPHGRRIPAADHRDR
ncbi:MAG: metal ABC transporter permease [Planctomycetota bacterium]